MANPRQYFGLALIPCKDHTIIRMQQVHSHIHQRLKDLIQAYIAQDLFICLV